MAGLRPNNGKNTTVCGVVAGAWRFTRSRASPPRLWRRAGCTRKSWFEEITPTPPWSTTGRTSSGGVSLGPPQNSRLGWADSANWGQTRLTGGSRVSSSTATGEKKVSRRRRWREPFASSPPKAVERSMAIPSIPRGNPTRVHSCLAARSQCSRRQDSVPSARSVRASWLCEEGSVEAFDLAPCPVAYGPWGQMSVPRQARISVLGCP